MGGNDVECTPENRYIDPEKYEGKEIKDITLHGENKRYPTHISIRLSSGKYIEIIPSLRTTKNSIEAQLETSRGGWFEVDRGPRQSEGDRP